MGIKILREKERQAERHKGRKKEREMENTERYNGIQRDRQKDIKGERKI